MIQILSRISWVTSQIAVGEAPQKEEFFYLRSKGIEAVVDLRSEDSNDQQSLENLGICFLHVPIEDGYFPTFAQLEEIFGFVDPFLDSGGKIYLHCQHGIGRSPLITLTVLVHRELPLPEAMKILEDNHPLTTFSIHQEKFISQFGQKYDIGD